ncbi:MAG: cadherin-like domain-containing protein, partial [Planctomycetales bacterium]|nr:cadherin-like domain-containing protein [Planctomycetales bacterium]
MRRRTRRRLLFESLEGRQLLATVAMPSDVPANPGDSVSIPLTIDDASELQAFDFTIDYDTAKLDLTNADVASGALTSTGWTFLPNVNDATGKITLSAFAVEPLAPVVGELATITFHVTSNGSGVAVLDLEGSLNEGNLSLSTVDGSIQIGDATNKDPTAVNDVALVSEGTSGNVIDVLANDTSAPDVGETLSIISVSTPSQGGTSAIAPDGRNVVYAPAPGFVGEESFTYTIGDGNGGTATARIDITVTAIKPVSIVRTNESFGSINEAVAAATAGDTILVGDGWYQESITVSKPLTIRSVNVGGAIIDGGGSTVKSVIRATANANIIGLHLT